MKTIAEIVFVPRGLGRPLAAVCLLLGAGPANTTASQPIEYITGGFGDEIVDLVPTGYMTGWTRLTAGRLNPAFGFESWLSRPDGTMTPIGFYDELHTSDQMERESIPLEVDNGGVTIGYSVRYGGSAEGTSAWIANRFGATIKLGYYDAAHTWGIGVKRSLPVDLNAAHQVVGYSIRSATDDARTAWLTNSIGRIQRIGLTDVAHTSADGRQWSTPVGLNDAGHTIGRSRFYNGRTAGTFGHTTWVRTSWGATRLIGFQSGVHRSLNGWHDSDVNFITNSGYIAGTSRRYRGHDRNGSTAWVTHVAGPNRPVGFYDGIHTAPNQIAVSLVRDINETGMTCGESLQFSGANPTEADAVGRTAWVAAPDGVTVRVGLYDAEYSRNGRQENFVAGLNDDNAAIGYAQRYGPDLAEAETTPWVANRDGSTTRLGLGGPGYPETEGYSESLLLGFSETRYVWGFTKGTQDELPYYGNVWWVYDRQAKTYLILNHVPDAPEGFENGFLIDLHVDDSGVVIGGFVHAEYSTVRTAFIYVPGEGIRLLNDVVTGATPPNFLHPVMVTPNGYIAGYQQGIGRQTAQDVFLLKR